MQYNGWFLKAALLVGSGWLARRRRATSSSSSSCNCSGWETGVKFARSRRFDQVSKAHTLALGDEPCLDVESDSLSGADSVPLTLSAATQSCLSTASHHWMSLMRCLKHKLHRAAVYLAVTSSAASKVTATKYGTNLNLRGWTCDIAASPSVLDSRSTGNHERRCASKSSIQPHRAGAIEPSCLTARGVSG